MATTVMETDIPEDVQLAVKAYYAHQPHIETRIVRRSTQDPNVYLLSSTRKFKSAPDGTIQLSYFCDHFKFDGNQPTCLALTYGNMYTRILHPPDWRENDDGAVFNRLGFAVQGEHHETMKTYGFLGEIKDLYSWSYIGNTRFHPPQVYSGTCETFNIFNFKHNYALWYWDVE